VSRGHERLSSLVLLLPPSRAFGTQRVLVLHSTRGQHATRVPIHATRVLPDRADAGPVLRMLELEGPSALFLSEKTSFDRSKKPRGSVGASARACPRQLLLLLVFVLCPAIQAAAKREPTACHQSATGATQEGGYEHTQFRRDVPLWRCAHELVPAHAEFAHADLARH
jgi:hypothetical protein